jgi:hypothetical protein
MTNYTRNFHTHWITGLENSYRLHLYWWNKLLINLHYNDIRPQQCWSPCLSIYTSHFPGILEKHEANWKVQWAYLASCVLPPYSCTSTVINEWGTYSKMQEGCHSSAICETMMCKPTNKQGPLQNQHSVKELTICITCSLYSRWQEAC